MGPGISSMYTLSVATTTYMFICLLSLEITFPSDSQYEQDNKKISISEVNPAKFMLGSFFFSKGRRQKVVMALPL